jgi:hypothetical protein
MKWLHLWQYICGSCKWKNIQLSPIFQHYYGDYQKFTWVGGNGSRRRFSYQSISLRQWHFLLHLSSKTIVRSIIRSILLVGLALNTRTELLKETLRQLPNGHVPLCFTWQPIGPNMPTHSTDLKQLTMQYECSTDF